MKIQKVLRLGIIFGLAAYGIKACDDLDKKMSDDLAKAKDNAKIFIKQHSPQKFDSLSNLKNQDVQVWLDAENQILDSLNSNSIYNRALLNLKSTAKDSLKAIK